MHGFVDLDDGRFDPVVAVPAQADGDVGVSVEFAGARGGVVHPERLEDGVAKVFLPGLAGDGLDNAAGDGEMQIAVLPGALDAGGLREFPVEEVVVPVAAVRFAEGDDGVVEAVAVGEQIADGYGFGEVVIGEVEPGQIGLDGFVEIDLALVDERHDAEAGEGFCAGGDVAGGIRREGEFRRQAADAEAFGVDEFVIVDDGDRKAGDVHFLHGVAPAGFEGGEGGVEIFGVGERGRSDGGEQAGEQTGGGLAGRSGHGVDSCWWGVVAWSQSACRIGVSCR